MSSLNSQKRYSSRPCQSHQKYFPVLHSDTGELTADFITIANIVSSSPDTIKRGNERVIRPRLSDAAFFWERDRKQPLEHFNPQTNKVVFQQKLGTVADKTAASRTSGYLLRTTGGQARPGRTRVLPWQNATC